MGDNAEQTAAKVDPRTRLRYTKASEREAVWFLGDRIEFILTGEMTDRRLMMYYHESHPDSQPPLHEHEVEDEIHYILEGGITYWAGDEEVTLYAGDSMVLPRDLPHTFRSLPNVSTKWFTITSPTNFEDFIREMSEPCTVDGPQPGWEMTPELATRLNDSAKRHGITLLGPPGTLPTDVPGGTQPVVRG